jgi:hypothetical protein
VWLCVEPTAPYEVVCIPFGVQAFTPAADVLMTPDEDYLFTTPEKLLGTIKAVLKAYKLQKNKTNLTGQAAQLMNPAVIERMTEISLEIEQGYM